MRAVSQQIPQPLTTKISLKITHLKFTLNLPGVNKLTPSDEAHMRYSANPVVCAKIGSMWSKIVHPHTVNTVRRVIIFYTHIHVVFRQGCWLESLANVPFLSFLDGTLHKHCLFIILYPTRGPPTFCGFSWLRSYFRSTALSSWWANALGFPKPQI